MGLAWAQYHPGNKACCLQSCSRPNLAIWLQDLDMLLQTPQEIGLVPPPLPPQAPRTESPTRRYFTIPACQVLRSWSQRPSSDGLATLWEWRTAIFQNRSSALKWLVALTGRGAKQSTTKTPSRTLWAPVISMLKAGSILQQIIALGSWQPRKKPKPSRKGDCHSLTSNTKPVKRGRSTQLLP